ncbi:MAG: multidrug efflux SMR transporter [Betaproteobacteria bacterium]|nr:multidrug efflux SMR transporter [Betaproteobacteria bacterium]
MHWMYLLLAVGCEILATSSLKASREFTRWLPSLLVVAGGVGSCFFLSLALRRIPLGLAYALWCGVGIVAISTVGRLVYDQRLDIPAWVGIGLILGGVLVIHLGSHSIPGA